MKSRWNHPHGLAVVVTAVLVGAAPVDAAPPDLTAGASIPSNLTTTWNLGPTGMRGWVYYDTTSGGINGSVESRQIQVRKVDSGSPAAGVFLPDDLILGASGTSAAPVPFDTDARRGLAAAIADAEARSPAQLKLIRWRAGAQSVVTLPLRTMGAYSASAPYQCPKSQKILKEGMDYYYKKESSGRYRMGALSLLAAQDDFFPDRALYLKKAQTEARALIKSTSELNALRNYTASTAYPIPWGRAHELILLGEYYLITGDAQVFPTIEALAINLAKGASHYGTVAHSLRQGAYDGSISHRPVNTGYGVVNSIGMPCLLGVQLAKRCGVDDPLVDGMIERAKMFYASYANRGAIPYGEHEAYDPRHENNGKCGLAAIVLDDDPDYLDQGGFFVMMALASGDTDRDVGHTGAYFNYFWAPLGAQRGGPLAVQEYFRKISWMLDLHRRWDGGFDYDSYSENRAPNGSSYYDFRMSTAMLLTYAIPLESLHLTGRDSTGALALSPARVSDCMNVEDYHATTRSTAQLVGDLALWSPKIRKLAAAELGKRSINTATRDEIRAKAMDVNGTSRYGAIQALGETKDTGYTGQLVSLLNDDDAQVRTLAAKALHLFQSSHKVPFRASMMQTLVSRERPAFTIDPVDPMQLDQAALITAIFGSGAFANSRSEMDTLISQVGSRLFFNALKVASRHPTGNARGRIKNLFKALTPAEVTRMAPELVDMVALESPADRMFSLDVRNEAMLAMARSLVADAVPAAMRAIDNSNGWGGFHENLLNALVRYGGSSTLVTPDPNVAAFARRYLTGGTLEEAQALLDAINADASPPPPLQFKSIVSVTADDPTVNIAANSTTLRVSAFDHARGDSVFTWRKISGPGNVGFSPNGTAAAATSTVLLDGTAGFYQFEVTMSDSRGLTEAVESIGVELADPDGLTPPRLVSIVDDVSGGPIPVSSALIYTVTFDKAIDATTIGPDDFGNLGSAGISIGSVTPTANPAVFEVAVSATGPGDLRLGIVAGAILSDLSGNPLTTTTALADDTTIMVLSGQLLIDGTASWKAESATVTGTFDASGSDKLVVILTGEHGFNNAEGTVSSVTYDGVPLTPVIQRNAQAAQTDTIYNHLWILDNPAASHVSGVIVANVLNRGNVTVFGLSGTLPGAGATAISNPNTRSVDLTTNAPGSLVIASFGMGGAGNTANVAAVAADPPLTIASAQHNGGSRNWDGHVTAYAKVATAGTGTYSFSGGNEAGAHVIAAEFLAASSMVTSPYQSWAGGAFASTLTDPGPALDLDAGGLATALEWVLGGDPSDGGDDAGIAPTCDNTTDPEFFIFTYRRADPAAADANTAIKVEYGSDLAGWTEAV
ncbi:MAG: DUF6288 domain-containing protein, partial [Luteolibacter sp.]